MKNEEDFFGAPHHGVGYSMIEPLSEYPALLNAALRMVSARDENSPPITCRACGAKRTKDLWTMVVPFHASPLLVISSGPPGGRVHRAFDPVCIEHSVLPVPSAVGELERTAEYFMSLVLPASDDDKEPEILITH